jgi:hypothetical protein
VSGGEAFIRLRAWMKSNFNDSFSGHAGSVNSLLYLMFRLDDAVVRERKLKTIDPTTRLIELKP